MSDRDRSTARSPAALNNPFGPVKVMPALDHRGRHVLLGCVHQGVRHKAAPGSYCSSIHKLRAATIMLATMPTIDRCSLPKERETGINSSVKIKTITPATADKTRPNTISLRKGIRIKAASAAPTGSDTP